MSSSPLRLRELLERLVRAEIRFILVGGLAVNAWGLLESSSISTFLRTGDRTFVRTDLGQVDVLQGLPQVPRFEELEKEAKEIDIDGLSVRVCSLGHLLAMKRASDRARDHEDIEELEAAQEQGGERS